MNCDNLIIDGVLYNYQYSTGNLHIEDSCKVSKKNFAAALVWINHSHPDLQVWQRSIASLKREWATHNLLHSLGIAKERTKDVDLNYPQRWYTRIAYWLVGNIALLFIH